MYNVENQPVLLTSPAAQTRFRPIFREDGVIMEPRAPQRQ
jgi:hypothetical protein